MSDAHPTASIVASVRFDDVAVLTFFVQERMRRGRKRRGESWERGGELRKRFEIRADYWRWFGPFALTPLAVKTSKVKGEGRRTKRFVGAH